MVVQPGIYKFVNTGHPLQGLLGFCLYGSKKSKVVENSETLERLVGGDNEGFSGDETADYLESRRRGLQRIVVLILNVEEHVRHSIVVFWILIDSSESVGYRRMMQDVVPRIDLIRVGLPMLEL